MKFLVVIIVAAVVAVLAILAMEYLGVPAAGSSYLRPAIAGAVAGVSAVLVSSRSRKS